MTLLPSIANVRDLGGIRVKGGTVREGLLLRGGSLSSASDEDIELLSERYHVRRIFDFRTSIERRYAPDREVKGAQNIWLPAFDESSSQFLSRNLPQEAYRDLGNFLVKNASRAEVQEIASKLYLNMVENDFTLVQYAGFLQNILACEGGAVYWHCSQGKDRTGLGAAFLLAALGADRDAIMDDFCLSKVFYEEELNHFLSFVSTDEEKAVLQTFISVNDVYFSQALDYMEKFYGSVQEMLQGPLCLSEEDLEKLRDYYLTA